MFLAETDLADHGPKYADPLTYYVALKSMDGAFFDEDAAAEHWVDFYGLIGRRIYRENEQGFCWLETHHDATTARAEFDRVTAGLYENEDEA